MFSSLCLFKKVGTDISSVIGEYILFSIWDFTYSSVDSLILLESLTRCPMYPFLIFLSSLNAKSGESVSLIIKLNSFWSSNSWGQIISSFSLVQPQLKITCFLRDRYWLSRRTILRIFSTWLWSILFHSYVQKRDKIVPNRLLLMIFSITALLLSLIAKLVSSISLRRVEPKGFTTCLKVFSNSGIYFSAIR